MTRTPLASHLFREDPARERERARARAGRAMRWSGAALAAGSTALIVALRSFLPPVAGEDPFLALGRGVVVASLALLLTMGAAVGLALLVAGVALRHEEKPARASRASARSVARSDDE